MGFVEAARDRVIDLLERPELHNFEIQPGTNPGELACVVHDDNRIIYLRVVRIQEGIPQWT